MIIIREKKRLAEVLQSVTRSEIKALELQATEDRELHYILNTAARHQPKYKYLADFEGLLLQNVTLMGIIDFTFSKRQQYESYFIKTSNGKFVGFIALTYNEHNKKVIDDVKVFAFGVSPKEDENMIRKDVPDLLDSCLCRFDKVEWTAHKDNKATIAYDIYCKRKGGSWVDDGKLRRYTCSGRR